MYYKWMLYGLLMGFSLLRAQSLHGVTRPHREANLSMSVPGLVSQITVHEGQTVEAGDILLELHREQEELESNRRALLLENPAEVQAAEARLNTARSEVEATRTMFEKTRSVSREELDRKLLQLSLAEAELTQARMNKKREEIELAMAREAVERRVLRAPHSGIITEILIEEGEGCEPLQHVMRLVDPGRLIVTANAEAEHLKDYTPGKNVTLTVQTREGLRKRDAEVRYVSPVVDRASGLGILRLEFDNADGSVVAGVAAKLQPEK